MNLVAASDPVLWTPAIPLTAEDRAMHQETFKELTALMHKLSGVSLSFPQVGLGLRAFVTRYDEFPVVVNPTFEALAPAGFSSRLEGCLSYPGYNTFVRRATEIRATWEDGDGNRKSANLAGIEARVWQHESDHLDGICVFARPAARMSA